MDPLDLSHITVEDVRRDMANIVTEYGPDHRAPRIHGGCLNWHAINPETGSATCYRSDDSSWTHVPSCIVGLWLFRHGVTLEMLRPYGNVGSGIATLAAAVVDLRPDVVGYLTHLQGYQDGGQVTSPSGYLIESVGMFAAFGRPWGAAVEYANAVYDAKVAATNV